MLLLASHSPRRRELLATAGFEFEVVSPRVREKFDVDLTLRELTAWNALRKGLAVARRRPNDVVLAADTLVALDREIIGKPRDMSDARKILRRLSGRTHQVCSSVFVCHLASARSTSFCEISRVHFHRLTARKIDNYFSKVDPLDKAGAYAAQGHGREIIARVTGSFTNVVGLPMEKVTAALREFGITGSRSTRAPQPRRVHASPTSARNKETKR
jgi:septum formation protein